MTISGSTRESFTACEDYYEVVLGNKVLQNNIWKRDSDGVQCVFPGLFSGLPFVGTEGDESAKVVASWMWDWPHTGDAPKSYPSLIYGFKPWRRTSTIHGLPLTLSSLNKLDVTYSISTQAQGAYNTTFEIWLTNSDNPKPKDITTEIMIWLGSQEVAPAGDYRGSVEVEGEKYGLWIGRIEHWKYIVFKAERPSQSGSLNLKSLFDELTRRREIGPDTWLSSIELGNEITYGEGHTVVNAFKVEH